MAKKASEHIHKGSKEHIHKGPKEHRTVKTDVAKRVVHERPKPEGTAPSSRPTSEADQPAPPTSPDTPVQEPQTQSPSDNQPEGPSSNNSN